MFERQCWWITGASSGIGNALALALAKRGARVILSGRNVAALQAVAKDCSDALVLPFEATDFDRIPDIAERAWSWQGRVDGLVNNAGVSQRSLAVETAFPVYQKMIDVDLLGPIALTQALLPRMVNAGGGTIVAIASVAGMAGIPLRSAYCAAKHAVQGFTESLRSELIHDGSQVPPQMVQLPALNTPQFSWVKSRLPRKPCRHASRKSLAGAPALPVILRKSSYDDCSARASASFASAPERSWHRYLSRTRHLYEPPLPCLPVGGLRGALAGGRRTARTVNPCDCQRYRWRPPHGDSGRLVAVRLGSPGRKRRRCHCRFASRAARFPQQDARLQNGWIAEVFRSEQR